MRFAPGKPPLGVGSFASRRLGAFVGVASIAVLFRVVLSFYIGPLTDVYYYDTQAVAALLRGIDPYGHLYTGIPAALTTPGAQTVFAYLPGVLLFLVPFAWTDVRSAMVVAELIVALAIFSLSGRWSTLASAVFLLIPAGALFSVVYPNNALPAMSFLGLGVLLESRNKKIPGAALIGAALATSQFAWLAYPTFLALWIRGRNWSQVAVSLGIASAMVLPFFAWNPSAFVQDALLFEFSRPVFPLVANTPWGLNLNPSISGLAVSMFGSAVPGTVRVLVMLAMLPILLWRTRGLKRDLFWMGCYLAAGMFILPGNFFWVYLELPLQMILMSIALDPKKRPAEPWNA